LKRGFDLYQRHCQARHGRQAEGAPDWRQRMPDNSYPPPPLNGSGHAWHHSLEKLRLLILDGGQAVDIEGAVTTMPPWRDRLSDTDVAALIAWFQSLWPDPVYAIWYEHQVRARGQ
jgi:mono/diheme cytochrome c family protein